jgi:hypothetical protein
VEIKKAEEKANRDRICLWERVIDSCFREESLRLLGMTHEGIMSDSQTRVVSGVLSLNNSIRGYCFPEKPFAGDYLFIGNKYGTTGTLLAFPSSLGRGV